jgi:hypothetical protein
MTDRRPLQDFEPPAKLKLSALWAACMFCYVYGDYFGLYRPGRVEAMNQGRMGPLGEVSPGMLVGVSAMMAIPSLMIFLSLTLPPAVGRWLNVALGLAYTAIMLLTMKGAAPFYLFLGVIECVLTLGIVWVALRWPRAPA